MHRLRAMAPWPGAYTFIDGKKQLGIVQGEPLWSNEAEKLGEMNQAVPGTVTSLKKGFGFTVRTGSGHLLVTAVQPEGKRLWMPPNTSSAATWSRARSSARRSPRAV